MQNNQNQNIFNTNKLQYNTLLMNAYSSFQNKQISKALMLYQQAEKINPQSLNSPLIKSIIGVLHMHSCNYEEAMLSFQNGIKQILIYRTKKQINTNNYEILSIYIKLLANSAMCHLVIGQYDAAIEKIQECLNIIRQQSQQIKIDLFQSLVYIFFRFSSFSSMKASEIQIQETKYDQNMQAYFYATLAINQELCLNLNQAYKLQKKVLQIWTNKKQYGYMLITVRHLLHLAKQLNFGKNIISDYENQIKKLLQTQKLGGISQKTLFKGYEQKMKCAKQITKYLISFQNEELPQKNQDQKQLKGWKEATKLKLMKAINTSKKLQLSTQGKNKLELKNAIQHMQQTLKCLDTQKNILIIKNLQKSKFVADSINYLKAQLMRIKKFFDKSTIKTKSDMFKRWRLIKNQMKLIKQKNSKFTSKNQMKDVMQSKHDRQEINKFSSIITEIKSEQRELPLSSIRNKQQMSQKSVYGKKNQIVGKFERKNQSSINSKIKNNSQIVSNLQKNHKLIIKCIKICEIGQYFMKRNFSSDGGQEKFLRLTKSEIQWATEQKKIENGKYQSYQLKQIRGIFYGKISDTFKKPCNKHLQAWKCFSLVLQKRTFDLYSDNQTDVSNWIAGISGAVKKANPQKQNLLLYRPGRILWRKMFLILYHHFYEPLKKTERNCYWSFAQAIIKFKQNNYKLPQKKKKMIVKYNNQLFQNLLIFFTLEFKTKLQTLIIICLIYRCQFFLKQKTIHNIKQSYLLNYKKSLQLSTQYLNSCSSIFQESILKQISHESYCIF